MTIVRNLLADVNRALSSGLVKSRRINSAPTSSCSISPAVTIGPIPRVVRVPICEANITFKSSGLAWAEGEISTPYRTMLPIASYTTSTSAVHTSRSVKDNFLPGFFISGRRREVASMIVLISIDIQDSLSYIWANNY